MITPASSSMTAQSALDTTPRTSVEELSVVGPGVDHSEGVCVADDGSVYASGELGQIYRIEDNGAVEVGRTGGFTLGLASDATGRLYVCDLGHHCIWRFDPADGSLQTFSVGAPGEPLVSPNWGAFGRDGTYYFTDSGRWKARDGRIFAVAPGGACRVWTRASVDFPNGLAVSPTGDELWVLESTPGRLVRFAILPDGSAGDRDVLADLSGTVPDGLAFAADGSVVIACYRPDALLRWHADLGFELIARDFDGQLLAAPTNCAFGGTNMATLFAANLAGHHITRLTVDGLTGASLFRPTAEQLKF